MHADNHSSDRRAKIILHADRHSFRSVTNTHTHKHRYRYTQRAWVEPPLLSHWKHSVPNPVQETGADYYMMIT